MRQADPHTHACTRMCTHKAGAVGADGRDGDGEGTAGDVGAAAVEAGGVVRGEGAGRGEAAGVGAVGGVAGGCAERRLVLLRV